MAKNMTVQKGNPAYKASVYHKSFARRCRMARDLFPGNSGKESFCGLFCPTQPREENVHTYIM